MTDELGPVTRYVKAEEDAGDLRIQLVAAESQRISDNEHLLSQIGELKHEIDRLKGIEDLTFDLGSHLKFLVTALCPIIKREQNPLGHHPTNEVDDWENMVACWEEARERLGLTPDGVLEEGAET